MTASANGCSQRSSSIMMGATVRLRHNRSHILVEPRRCARDMLRRDLAGLVGDTRCADAWQVMVDRHVAAFSTIRYSSR